MTDVIKITGNDAIGSGVITVNYSSGYPSPLGFIFERDGIQQSFSVHSEYVKKLAVFLVENMS